MKYLQNEYMTCECLSNEHTLRYVFCKSEKPGDDPSEIYTEVYLNDWRPWYKRVWVGIKYIFGYKCRYGHWDTFIMQREEATKLRKLLQEFEGTER